MQPTPSRPRSEGPPVAAPSPGGGGRLAALLSLLALASIVTLAIAAIPRPEPPPGPLPGPAGVVPEPDAAVAIHPPGPPLCSAEVRPADETSPGSGATAAWLSVACDQPGLLVARSPRGDPAGAELGDDGSFEGPLGRHYLCAGAVTGLALAVTGAGGRWESTAPLAASPGAPACDVLIRPGATELAWERDSIAVADAFADGALGPPRGFGANSSARPLDHLVVRHRAESGRWLTWRAGSAAAAPLERLEAGKRYVIAADAEIAWTFPDAPPAPATPPAPAAPAAPRTSPGTGDAAASVFDGAQIVSYYGYPDIPAMGILGAGAPEDAADGVAALAASYDELNGDRDVIPALHLIAGVATSQPGPDGLHLRRLPKDRVLAWIRLAEERGQLIFLDLQIGWSEALTEVRALGEFLREPHVHLALDPEFATLGMGRPGDVIGQIDAATVDGVQAYLAGLVREEGIPPKVLVLHQFLDSMLPGAAGGYADHPEVDVVVDMDGFGPPRAKLVNYRLYALSAYAERAGLKLFFLHDEPVMTPDEVQALDSPPALVIYQ